MATNEFSPELDESVLAAIRRKIEEQRAQQVSEAQGQAINRGLTGSTFEATRLGLADRAATNATTDAMVNLALQRAQMQREERLTQEQRAYESGEAEKSRIFAGNEAEINRQYGTAEGERGSRDSLINAGISGGAGLVGNLLGRGGSGGGLFGFGGTPKYNPQTGELVNKFNPATGQPIDPSAPGLFSAIGAANIGKSFLHPGSVAGPGSGIGSTLGYGAGLFGGSYAGQNLAKLTGKNTNEAKFGSAAGAGLGTLFGGPIGGVIGGAAGGLVTKGIQGVGKATKKLFCFAPDTPIEMADGSIEPIYRVLLGDRLKGGKVKSVRIAEVEPNTFYDYKGVKVTGYHAVREDGKWIRVKDSKLSSPIEEGGIVFSLVTTDHRIFVGGIEFADEIETDDYEDITIDQSLDKLNQEELTNAA